MTRQLCAGCRNVVQEIKKMSSSSACQIQHEYESPRQVVKTQIAGPHAQSFMGLRIYISGKFSDHANDLRTVKEWRGNTVKSVSS